MNTHSPPPTLQDVATRAGVSTATVSRCLNSPGKVVEETRARVLQAVRDLGYSPHFGARVMATNRSRTIGAVIPTMDNAIFAHGLQAFQDELRAHGYTLLVASSAYRADLEDEQVRALVARGADGLLLIGHDRDSALYRFLETQRVPSVVAWTLDAERPSVGFDNYKAMAELVREVLALGHKRLAVITAETAPNDRARARISAIRDAMADEGLDADGLPIIETTHSIQNGAKAFEELMTRSPRPTAILCGNDVQAVGAMRRAHEMGISVPDMVSITGFGDLELAQATTPELTTVRVPHSQMGRDAARLLVDLVERDGGAETIALETRLQMRGSLATPPSGAGRAIESALPG